MSANASRVHRRHTLAALTGGSLATVLIVAIALSGPAQATTTIAQQDPGVMAQKLNQAIQTLQQSGAPKDAGLQAIDEAMEAIYTGNLVVLPTSGETEQDTDDAFEAHQQMVQQALQALTQHVNDNGNARAAAAEARNFIQVTGEAIEQLAGHTGAPGCNPSNPSSCGPLNQQAEIPRLVDPVLGTTFQRPVRSPFPLMDASGHEPPAEVMAAPGGLANGECSPVVKEMRGVTAVVRPTNVPIWSQPWTSKAHIIGSRLVWVYELVPAEHIKTLIYCNKQGQLTLDVMQRLVLDRGALMLWRGLVSKTAG